MFYFPDSDTGYYDTDPTYREEDARAEAQQLQVEDDRFEYEAEEAQARLWVGESDIDQATRRAPITGEGLITAHPPMSRGYLGLPEIPEVTMCDYSVVAIPAARGTAKRKRG